MSTSSYCRVYDVVRRIPRGKVATYGQVAALAGLGKHARLVGYALAALEDDQVPWHRVVGSRGRLTIGSGIQEQRARLLAEGVRVSEDGKLDLGEARWNAAHDGPAL